MRLKISAAVAAIAMAGLMMGAGSAISAETGKKQPAPAEKTTTAGKPEKAEAKVAPKEEMAVINTRHGKIKIKFFPDVAPKHVESMKKLISQKFYDGCTFHRVIPGFMIQGGDPNSKDPNKRHLHGTGGPGYTVPAEFNARSHKRGILSAARAQNPDSAGSQFFIVVKDSPFLDGQYTVFGEVVEGMDVADKIVAEERDRNDNPLNPVTMTVTLE